MAWETKLGLGGHSFIQELGNDPLASFEEQCRIVATCLDNGVRWIDTTYYQERVALGRALQALGRWDEARVTAWNFFRQPGKEQELVGPTPYVPDSLSIQLEELETDRLDLLVIHRHDDPERWRTEMDLARRWRDAGLVRAVGLGMAQRSDVAGLPEDHPFTHVLAPYNAFNRAAGETFAEAKKRGLTAVAMSPFVRGWKLEKLGGDRSRNAGLLLRWVTSQPTVDAVVVSMRRAEWVTTNLAAERQGPLTDEETATVDAWSATVV